MEGDVLLSSIWPAILAAGGAVFGGVFALLKWFAGRILSDIETRLKRVDDVECRLDTLLSELPLHYQRREDAIREYTAINAKLDRLYEILVRKYDDTTD
ncbi:MAG: hypothetical protein PHC35_01755 [Deltaproteobacteria bacterium]|nr:hypothetical protein [Deltaproteobacteria bacterium]